jgi:hypothetical protein
MIKMRVRWEVLSSGEDKVEAQIWEPDFQTHKAILFCPGFPGAGAGLFEQRHAAAIAEAGYALIVLRHAGTRLEGPCAPAMINNGARLQQGRTRGETHIGDGPSSIAAWLREPFTALAAISDDYEDIFVLGNSFGALSALWSMGEAGARLDKVRHLLLLAGAQGVLEDGGVTDIMRLWKAAYMAMPRVTERISLSDPVADEATLLACYQDLPRRAKNIPDSIGLDALVVARDEILTRSDAEKFQAAIGGRGTIYMNDIDRAYADPPLLAHDMPDYPTAALLALLDNVP